MSKKTSFRNVRRTNFTQVNNEIINDKNLTLEAKGLLTIFLSNSDDWNINMKEIITRSKNGRDAHYRVVKELITQGYFARIEIRGKGKKGFEKMEYLFSDNKEDVVYELEEIKAWAKENDKQIFIEYMDQQDKNKKRKTLLDTGNQDTGNQNADNEYAGNEYPGNQDIKNTKGNNTKSNNTKVNNTRDNNTNLIKEEEEENIIYNACSDNITYLALNDFLQAKKVGAEARKNIIQELINRGIESLSINNAIKQYNYMMDKIIKGEVDNHNNFAIFFVNGLEMKEEQSKLSKEHQLEELRSYQVKLQEKEERKKRVDRLYYDWLNNEEQSDVSF